MRLGRFASLVAAIGAAIAGGSLTACGGTTVIDGPVGSEIHPATSSGQACFSAMEDACFGTVFACDGDPACIAETNACLDDPPVSSIYECMTAAKTAGGQSLYQCMYPLEACTRDTHDGGAYHAPDATGGPVVDGGGGG